MDNGNLKWAIHFFVTFLIFIEKAPYHDLKKKKKPKPKQNSTYFLE